jgi:hypothetical protein
MTSIQAGLRGGLVRDFQTFFGELCGVDDVANRAYRS